MPRYYDDVDVGTVPELSSLDMTAQESEAFAEKYDPLPFHIDDEAAFRTPSTDFTCSRPQTEW